MMQDSKIDLVKIEKLRRHRRRRKLTFIIALMLFVCMVLAYFTGLYGASLSVFGDLVDTAYAAINKGDGYPINFTMTGLIKAQPLAGGFASIGESDFAIYSSSGKELRRLQHGYARPAMSCGNTRAAIYNRAGTELRIESRSRNLFRKIFDKPIQLVEMSAGGSFAVITQSLRYEAELTVFNSLFEPAYYWYSAQDTPVCMAMSRDGRKVAVAAVSPQAGALSSHIYMLDIGLDEPAAEIISDDTLPLQLKYLPNGDLAVIYDAYAAVYSQNDGKELYRYNFDERTLQTAAIEDKYIALVFTDASHLSDTSLVLLSGNMEEMCSEKIGSAVVDICTVPNAVNVLSDTQVFTYGTDGKLWEKQAIQGKGETIINSKKLLLFTRNNVSELTQPVQPKSPRKSLFK
ncbi:MAG: DUF5711 family protein [Oscillospiraceae bacterium]